MPQLAPDLLARARLRRAEVPPASHSAVGAVERDPLPLLHASSGGRIARLVPLRYGRMRSSPFAFFRGSAMLQAHDLAATPYSGIIQQLCGDAHLANFGGFASPERTLLFDLNDFDETHPGPWEWDLKRLAASFVLAARYRSVSRGRIDDILDRLGRSYREHMREYAGMSALDVWYDRISYERLLERIDDADAHELVKKSMKKASKRTHERLLPKIAGKVDGGWRINDELPSLFHIFEAQTLFSEEERRVLLGSRLALRQKLFDEYLQTISISHRELLQRFSMQDLVCKVVGVGSVGTRCMVLLLTDAQEQPLFLQIKEARPSVLAPYVPQGRSEYANEGQRVVVGKRLMQAYSDIFLGWSHAGEHHFYFRQLRDMKISLDIDNFTAPLLEEYAGLCGWVLARAHARSGGLAGEIAAYLGGDDAMVDALRQYALAYADQAERDYAVFDAACCRGEFVALDDGEFSEVLRRS
ncbi:DUF2252 domain-containing protein [Chitinilyticum piscinae]|uniref:DUF2252 domain-containing protein n=1 Tax=Chitinilyticum piscinae TaxID=2866724 RepID=A0A8J7KAL9_9NEIS|nr:DUF2252 domain-containing protein [Chitinilyticum piscinae]MBE9609274.1 DUF2252 domain-containing protein [Chitinilyticum piscinae]